MILRVPHCCEQLENQIQFICDQHPNEGGCGDYIMGYSATFDEFGIWVHDGPGGSASSWIAIQFCPYCGSRLP